ncbi:hypothetical protein BYT27DRAFT_6860396 [Phlegmacium glaucopus]|nr:hypothetical protein BYT27DRAFT_6860396 [Phlegmacium glaucopus]
MKMMDARVQDVTEAVNVLRMIKLFGWERRMSERIRAKRNNGLRWLRQLKVLETLNWITSNMIPTVVMLVTYATHTVFMKQELTRTSKHCNRKLLLNRNICSFQDLLQYTSVFFVEDAVTTLVISNLN